MTRKKISVTQSNELTEATYSLDLQSKRLIWLCLMQRYHQKEINNLNPLFTISVKDYAETFGVAAHTASKDVRKAIEGLSEKAITFHIHDEHFEVVKRPWLAEAGAKSGWGEWSIEFNQKIMPFIAGLTSRFTTYDLYDCGKLKSVNTIRLYECLCQYRSTGVFTASHEWLVERFELPKSQANNRAELRRAFIEPSIKNINKNTMLNVSYSENSEGRFVFNFVFRETRRLA